MLANIIFCTSVLLATLTVILLALFSPLPSNNNAKNPPLALSLYIQQPQISSSNSNSNAQQVGPSDAAAGAFIFHHTLTEGPKNTSRVVGRAQGFIIPVEQFAHSAFNVIYLSFDTPEHSGSVSVKAQGFGHTEELTVVGGTGSFAFARGVAVFAQPSHGTYHVKLRLRFPHQTISIPG